jgi:hypothetical protein
MRPQLTRKELADHLGVHRNSVAKVIDATGLKQSAPQRFNANAVLRNIHKIEPGRLSEAIGILRDADITEASDLVHNILSSTLLKRSDVARRLGMRDDAFRKMLERGGLPLSPLRIGLENDYWRALDVDIWLEHGIVIEYPAVAAQPDSATHSDDSSNITHSHAQAQKKAVFGPMRTPDGMFAH